MIKNKIVYFISILSLLLLKPKTLPAVSYTETGLDKARGKLPGGSVPDIIAIIINGLLGLVGTLFVVLIVYGGFLWMTSAGNEDKVKKARELIINASIGIAIVILSYVIVKTVMSIVLDEGLSTEEVAEGSS